MLVQDLFSSKIVLLTCKVNNWGLLSFHSARVIDEGEVCDFKTNQDVDLS